MKALESIQADRRKQQHSNHPSHSSRDANKVFVNNKTGLKQSLEDFQWTNKANWFDHLVVVGENREEKLETVDDDLTRGVGEPGGEEVEETRSSSEETARLLRGDGEIGRTHEESSLGVDV